MPDEVRRSLVIKVDSSGRITQDTGTGGSWPVSTDRMAWALAAWELYAVTGDRTWLRQCYDVIRRSADADLAVAFDSTTGLFRGESSFLDWREQSYPAWMDPRDIYQSQSLGTNALHYATYRVLSRMASLLGESPSRWDSVAVRVRQATTTTSCHTNIDYYGRVGYVLVHESVAPLAEGLGGALALLEAVAAVGQREVFVDRAPVAPFGVPILWGYIGDHPLY